jgi:short-subunit dehydrogenase
MAQAVVVTGASAGVGRAVATAFAEKGATVGLIARGQSGLEGAMKDVESAGGRAIPLAADVADVEAVFDAADTFVGEAGGIDVWVNDAMTTIFGPVWDLEPGELERATHVIYLGTAHGTLAALRHMRPRDAGVIVNVSSALAFRGIPLQAPYCASKFAIRGFSESVRTELLHEHSHVRITLVHLPAINTPQFDWCRNRMPMKPVPVAPIYKPEQAAAAVLAAASSRRRDRTLGSINKAVIVGTKLAPGLFDHFAVASWEGQQSNEPAHDRPDNLFEPVDGADGLDHGTEGRFGDRAGGALDPSYIKQIPKTAAQLVRATRDRVRYRLGLW